MPQDLHASGTLDEAEAILAQYSEIGRSNIYIAAILGDETAVRGFLSQDRGYATAAEGPYEWDALTYLCFSRYLRLDPVRSEDFMRTARALLEAGASATTGWYEQIDSVRYLLDAGAFLSGIRIP